MTKIYLVEAEYENDETPLTWAVCYSKTKQGAERAIAEIQDKYASLQKLIDATSKEQHHLVSEARRLVEEAQGPAPKYYFTKINYRDPDWTFEKSEEIRKQDFELNKPYYAYRTTIQNHPSVVAAKAKEAAEKRKLAIRNNRLLNYTYYKENSDRYYIQPVDRFYIVEVGEAQ